VSFSGLCAERSRRQPQQLASCAEVTPASRVLASRAQRVHRCAFTVQVHPVRPRHVPPAARSRGSRGSSDSGRRHDPAAAHAAADSASRCRLRVGGQVSRTNVYLARGNLLCRAVHSTIRLGRMNVELVGTMSGNRSACIGSINVRKNWLPILPSMNTNNGQIGQPKSFGTSSVSHPTTLCPNCKYRWQSCNSYCTSGWI